MFIGIGMSMVYSKSIKRLLVKNSLQQSNDKKDIYTTFYYDDSTIIKPYRAKFELYNNPSSSVAFKLKLGKISRVDNHNIPKLDLLFSAIDKVTFQTEVNNHFNHNISHNYSSFQTEKQFR
jgi:hydroxymethylpyrimidine pyrophosphatase-like HAD family hydrolase